MAKVAYFVRDGLIVVELIVVLVEAVVGLDLASLWLGEKDVSALDVHVNQAV